MTLAQPLPHMFLITSTLHSIFTFLVCYLDSLMHMCHALLFTNFGLVCLTPAVQLRANTESLGQAELAEPGAAIPEGRCSTHRIAGCVPTGAGKPRGLQLVVEDE